MDHYEEFKAEILKMTKIDLSSYKEKQMKRRIESLVTKRNLTSFADYLKLLKTDTEAFNEFINFMTINVSEFYRNPDQWKLLTETFIPELMQKNGNRLKIWSAACSTGDEPYSLVMALSGLMPLRDIHIYATDIELYNNERGFCYPLETTPFPIATNNDELAAQVAAFDEEKYL